MMSDWIPLLVRNEVDRQVDAVLESSDHRISCQRASDQNRWQERLMDFTDRGLGVAPGGVRAVLRAAPDLRKAS